MLTFISLSPAGPSDGRVLSLLSQPELGAKKKKRKKHKVQKAGSVDTESVGGTDSDPGLRPASVDNIGGVEVSGVRLGHRRCGSATASFMSFQDQSTAEKGESGREVQFCLGGRTISAQRDSGVEVNGVTPDPSLSVSLPYMIPSPSDPSSVRPAVRGQRSKSVSTPPTSPLGDSPSCVTFDGGGTAGMTQVHTWPVSPGGKDEPSSDAIAMHKLPFHTKPKKPVACSAPPTSKVVNAESTSAPQRKGSFRGGGGSEGCGGRGKGGKKPGRVQVVERA